MTKFILILGFVLIGIWAALHAYWILVGVMAVLIWTLTRVEG